MNDVLDYARQRTLKQRTIYSLMCCRCYKLQLKHSMCQGRLELHVYLYRPKCCNRHGYIHFLQVGSCLACVVCSFLRVVLSGTYCVVFFPRLVCHKFPVSLDCPVCIGLSLFSKFHQATLMSMCTSISKGPGRTSKIGIGQKCMKEIDLCFNKLNNSATANSILNYINLFSAISLTNERMAFFSRNHNPSFFSLIEQK